MYTTVGVLQADSGVIREHDHIFRLFCHECQRVFHDRLIDRADKKYFYGILSEMASKHFQKVRIHIHTYVCTCTILYVHVHTLNTHTHTTHTHTLEFDGTVLLGAHSRQDGGVTHCLWRLHEGWSTQIRPSVRRTLQHQEDGLCPHRGMHLLETMSTSVAFRAICRDG